MTTRLSTLTSLTIPLLVFSGGLPVVDVGAWDILGYSKKNTCLPWTEKVALESFNFTVKDGHVVRNTKTTVAKHCSKIARTSVA